MLKFDALAHIRWWWLTVYIFAFIFLQREWYLHTGIQNKQKSSCCLFNFNFMRINYLFTHFFSFVINSIWRGILSIYFYIYHNTFFFIKLVQKCCCEEFVFVVIGRNAYFNVSPLSPTLSLLRFGIPVVYNNNNFVRRV